MNESPGQTQSGWIGVAGLAVKGSGVQIPSALNLVDAAEKSVSRPVDSELVGLIQIIEGRDTHLFPDSVAWSG